MTGKCGNTPTYTVIGSGAVLKTVAHLWSEGSSPSVGATRFADPENGVGL